MSNHALHDTITSHTPYPLLFASITGSRAFGCSSPTSDYDVHGVHLLPVQEVLGLGCPHETIEHKTTFDELEVDIATHDLKKFVLLLLKGNGNVLEDLYSEHVVTTSPLHEELRVLGKGCITKRVAYHYKGHAWNQQRRMNEHEVKKYLHTYRCLLMGIHLMRTGELLMDISLLADMYHHPQMLFLLADKASGITVVTENNKRTHQRMLEQLMVELEQAREESHLPEKPAQDTRDSLEQVVIRVRLETR